MTTIATRTFRSIPHLDATQTWNAIVELLIQGRTGQDKAELYAVSGVASSVIADQYPKSAPIVVTCNGPRTRIYCIYDDDALDAASGYENQLGFNPLAGDWHISLPCHTDELPWIQAALKKYGTRITARDLENGVSINQTTPSKTTDALVLDVGRFLNS